jgi:hypothetical protein
MKGHLNAAPRIDCVSHPVKGAHDESLWESAVRDYGVTAQARTRAHLLGSTSVSDTFAPNFRDESV